MTYKVLVVDDQDGIREVLAECLELGGYEACVASNGEEGLRQLEEHQPDLVVTDMRMPVMDGFEFARRIRQTRDVPILMLTGLGEAPQDDSTSGLIDAFLGKPIQMVDFLDQVESALARKSAPPISVVR